MTFSIFTGSSGKGSSANRKARNVSDLNLTVRGATELIRSPSLRLVLALPVLSVAVMLFAAYEYKMLQADLALLREEEIRAVPALDVRMESVQPAELEKRVAKLSGWSGARIMVQTDTIRVTSTRLSDWNAWRGLVMELIVQNPDLMLSMDMLCAGPTCPSEALQVTFRARKRSYVAN